MKQTFLALFFLSLFFSVACNKLNCIEGTVLDEKTGNPIAGVYMQMQYQYSEYGSLKHSEPAEVTDNSGAFSYTADEKDSQGIGITYVYKSGYTAVFKQESNQGKGCKEVIVKLTPLDGLLKLNVINQTGTYDSIFVQVFNKCDYWYFHSGGITQTQPYPLTLPQGVSHTETFSTCVGDSSAIQWKFTKNGPWFNVDSILVNTGDTMLFNINY